MRSQARYIFSILLLAAGLVANAQGGVSVHDTVIVSQPYKNVSGGAFLPVQQQIIEEKKIPAEKLASLKKQDDYWYANLKPEKEIEEPRQSTGKGLFNADWFGNLLWIIIIVSFIAVVIWYLALSNVQLFRKAPRKIVDEEDAGLIEDIFGLNYDKEITKAVQQKDYRVAVRLWYLRTLKELSDKGIINYGHEKTNSEYLNTLFGSRYYHDFFRLTRNFEYTWYGQFPLSEDGFAMMQKDFTAFKNSLPK